MRSQSKIAAELERVRVVLPAPPDGSSNYYMLHGAACALLWVLGKWSVSPRDMHEIVGELKKQNMVPPRIREIS